MCTYSQCIRRVALVVLWIAGFAQLWADGQRRVEPPCYVPADSVVLWSDGSDFRSRALAVDPRLQARPFVKLTGRARKARLQQWRREVLPALNVIGGVGEDLNREQGIAGSNVLRLAAELFPGEPDARWFDVAERTLCNALSGRCLSGTLDTDQHVAAQAMVDATGCMLAADAEGVYINLFANSTTHVAVAGWDFYLDQLTAMPCDGRVRLRLTGFRVKKPQLTLRVRIPDWARGGTSSLLPFDFAPSAPSAITIYVNGRAEEVPVEKGYAIVCRRWNKGDEVWFDLPMQPRLLRRRGDDGQLRRGQVALQRGPLVYSTYAAQLGYFSATAPLTEVEMPNRYGSPILEGNLYDDHGVPADATAPALPRAWEPWGDRPQEIWMREIH